MHEEDRNDLINELHHTGPISSLLSSEKKHVAKSLADFLTKIQQVRRTRNKDEEVQEQKNNIDVKSGDVNLISKNTAIASKSGGDLNKPTTLRAKLRKGVVTNSNIKGILKNSKSR